MGGIRFEAETWSVSDVLRRWGQLQLEPEYQREGDIWSLSRRQLFIDSILNGFDSPKVYLHELVPPEFSSDSLLRYAVIDGRQRLETIKAFADGAFSLSPDFSLMSDEGVEGDYADDEMHQSAYAQQSLLDLRESYGVLARRFTSYPLTIVVVRTDDTSYIEELFFRLNEGAPLTAAEKRNRGELLRASVAEIRQHPAFDLLSVSDRRGRVNDLIVRFLYLEEREASLDRVPDLKARLLNDFSSQFRPNVGETFGQDEEQRVTTKLADLAAQSARTLDGLAAVFEHRDPLLRRVGDILTFYVLFRSEPALAGDRGVRDRIGEFFERATGLEGLAEEALSSDELSVIDYFGSTQGTTTGSYLAARAKLVFEFVRGQLDVRQGGLV